MNLSLIYIWGLWFFAVLVCFLSLISASCCAGSIGSLSSYHFFLGCVVLLEAQKTRLRCFPFSGWVVCFLFIRLSLHFLICLTAFHHLKNLIERDWWVGNCRSVTSLAYTILHTFLFSLIPQNLPIYSHSLPHTLYFCLLVLHFSYSTLRSFYKFSLSLSEMGCRRSHNFICSGTLCYVAISLLFLILSSDKLRLTAEGNKY